MTTTMGELYKDDGVEDVVMMKNGNSTFVDCSHRPSSSLSSSTTITTITAVGITEGIGEEGSIIP